MSIKFRHDGAVFPTEVKDGKLRIFIGSQFREVPLKFLKDDFPYDVSAYPQSNIMCYLHNQNKTIVMRYNGTYTVYNRDGVVIGFGSFEKEHIYALTDYIPIGLYSEESRYGAESLYYCTFYRFKGEGDEYAFENLSIQRPFIIRMSQNPEFLKDLVKADRHYPRFRKNEDGSYIAGNPEYKLIGYYIELSNNLDI